MSIESRIQTNYPLAPLSTFRIGGPAEYFMQVVDKEDLEEVWLWAKQKNLEVTLLGGGSNILINDAGIKGLVIKLNNIQIKIEDFNIICGASATVWDVAQLASVNSLTGMEWAIGIPGSMGGAVRGNAGAHGGAFDKIVKTVTVFDSDTYTWQDLDNDQCEFKYRHSKFKQEPTLIIWETILALSPGDQRVIIRMVGEYQKYRQACQPIEPSAGCMFKNLYVKAIAKVNPDLAQKILDEDKAKGEKIGAGYLIESLGLKGFSIGGAKISEQHANFIVNTGSATAEDVVSVANKVKQSVKQAYNIELEEEVQFLGF